VKEADEKKTWKAANVTQENGKKIKSAPKAVEMQKKLAGLDAFQTRMLGGTPDDPLADAVNGRVRKLIDNFTESHISDVPERTPKSVFPQDGIEDPTHGTAKECKYAADAEIMSCVGRINFVRWLCGWGSRTWIMWSNR